MLGMLLFEIPWEPQSWQAPRLGKYTTYDPKEAEKRSVRFLIREAYKGIPLEEYVVIFMRFVFSMPQSASRIKRAQMIAGDLIPTRKDCTNCQKLYEDCLKKIVISDDRLVAKIFSEKLYGEKDRVIIKVLTLQEYKCALSSMKLTELFTLI
jgi:Holliday junction resolvase RusA-like endonuclease